MGTDLDWVVEVRGGDGKWRRSLEAERRGPDLLRSRYYRVWADLLGREIGVRITLAALLAATWADDNPVKTTIVPWLSAFGAPGEVRLLLMTS